MSWENSPAIVLPIYALIVVVGIVVILKLSKDKTRKNSTLRLFIQIVALVAVFMGLIIGPFNVQRFQPLGITPRDHLFGADFLGNQFPDGISLPILACYYQWTNGHLRGLAAASLHLPILEPAQRL
jgi:hypothetical protein